MLHGEFEYQNLVKRLIAPDDVLAGDDGKVEAFLDFDFKTMQMKDFFILT